MRTIFMQTERLEFSKWKESDLELAIKLWGEPNVTKYICATGSFEKQDIKKRLETEITNDKKFGVQYWPIFERSSKEFIGCCGVRPFEEESCLEMGFHLREEFWGKGYATEAAKAAISYCFNSLGTKKLYAGHHPENKSSKRLLQKLGFKYIGDHFYEPTGLYHPSYVLQNETSKIGEENHMERVYNKLVRDKIPEIIEASGKTATISILDDNDYKRSLFEKLTEEVNEFKEDESLEELCDVLEVLDALKETLGFSKEAITEVKRKKAEKRGGFKKKLFLEKVEE